MGRVTLVEILNGLGDSLGGLARFMGASRWSGRVGDPWRGPGRSGEPRGGSGRVRGPSVGPGWVGGPSVGPGRVKIPSRRS